MLSKVLNETPERTLALVFNPGEEITVGLHQIAVCE